MSYIKIYFENKPVFLCDTLTKELIELREKDDTIFMDSLSNYDLQSMPREIQKPNFNQGIIYNENLDELKSAFFEHFTIIKAGGGLVRNNDEEILLIFRRGKWDLPKGKLDEGESLEECALREVAEETGLTKIELGEKISITYHTYVERGTLILKESHWFNMKAFGTGLLIPQTEEDILEIIWAKKENLAKYKANTFPAIIELLDLA
ncbi:MAG: NUDIX domain-containing protein [Ginsengibacter sp.]